MKVNQQQQSNTVPTTAGQPKRPEKELFWPTEKITSESLKPLFSVRSSKETSIQASQIKNSKANITITKPKPATSHGAFGSTYSQGQIRVYLQQLRLDDADTKAIDVSRKISHKISTKSSELSSAKLDSSESNLRPNTNNKTARFCLPATNVPASQPNLTSNLEPIDQAFRNTISKNQKKSKREIEDIDETLKSGNVILPAPIKVSAKATENNANTVTKSTAVNPISHPSSVSSSNSNQNHVANAETNRDIVVLSQSTSSQRPSMSSAGTERDNSLGTKDYLFAQSYYNRPKEVQPYCHVPKGRAGQLMGWRKAQKESLAWEAQWDPPIIHHTLLSQIHNRKLQEMHHNHSLTHRPHTHHAGNLYMHYSHNQSRKSSLKRKAKSRGSSDFVLPSISESTQPYVYPERQEISLLDEGFIRSLLSSRECITPKSCTRPARLMTTTTARGAHISKPESSSLSTTSSPAAALSEAIRAFVVAGTASKEVQDSSNDLDLRLQIIELFLKEKSLFEELEQILKKEDVKDTRARRVRRKQVIRVFRRLHERVVRLVESQPAEEVSKARQAHMDRFLEASRRNLIFLKNVGAYDPWPEMQAQLNLLTSVVPQLITI